MGGSADPNAPALGSLLEHIFVYTDKPWAGNIRFKMTWIEDISIIIYFINEQALVYSITF